MKPKIRYFCVACQRPKMLFETQEEADRFIAYNRGDILKGRRKAPVRSYYCEICGGWHVTSNPSKEDAKRLNVKDKALAEEVDRRVKANLSSMPSADVISKKLDEADKMMTQGSLEEAEKLLTECHTYLQMTQLRVSISKSNGHIKRMQQHNKLTQKLEHLKKLIDASPEEQRTLLKELKDKEIDDAFLSICAVDNIKDLLHEINLAINDREFNLVMSLYAKCLKQIAIIQGPGRKAIARKYHKRLFGAMHRAKVAKQEMKSEPKVVAPEPDTHNEAEEFDSVLDAIYGKPGSPEREAFRREALEYAENMDLQVEEETEE